MNIVIALLYGLYVWMSFIFFSKAIDGNVWMAMGLGPVIVSGGAVVLLILDWGLCWVGEKLDRVMDRRRSYDSNPVEKL